MIQTTICLFSIVLMISAILTLHSSGGPLNSPAAPIFHPDSSEFESARDVDSADAARRDAKSMSVEVSSIGDLSSIEFDRWNEIRSSREDLYPPFFSPEFSKSVQRARGDVRVAVVRSGGAAIGFLPFHSLGRHAHPVGRFFNDAQNVICEPGANIGWDWLLRSMGISSYDFHALVGEDQDSLPAHACHGMVQSFRCELGDDSSAYLGRMGKEHKTLGRQGQKTRKMSREIGPVSLEIDCRDRDLLQKTIAWKREQYRRTNILDLFTPPWTMRLMEDLFDPIYSQDAPLRGILSVLRAGDTVVAAHYGMLENGLLHYWFPAYDRAYGRYSPGTGLFCEILRVASDHGIRCLDMGYGEQPYKLKQTDATGTVLQGCVSTSPAYRYLRCAQSRLTKRAKQLLPGKDPIKWLGRKLFPNAGISKLD